MIDLRKVVNPVDYICPNATLSFVQLSEAESSTLNRDLKVEDEVILAKNQQESEHISD